MDGGYAAILNHHLHTCCTYNDAWLPHGCQLEWCSDSDSSKPPLSIRKWYAESERRTYIIITGLPKTCYMYVKIVRAFPWYLHTHHVCLDAHVTINISVMIQIVGLTWSEGLFFGKIKQCVWGEGRPYIEVKGCQSLEEGGGRGWQYSIITSTPVAHVMMLGGHMVVSWNVLIQILLSPLSSWANGFFKGERRTYTMVQDFQRLVMGRLTEKFKYILWAYHRQWGH